MTTETIVAPNAPESTVSTNNAIPSLDSIAAKMTAMRAQTQRNQLRANQEGTETGAPAEGNAESPVAPEGTEQSVAEPEIDDTGIESAVSPEEDQAQETVSEDTDADTTAQEIIDFIEFAETNPNAKFKFTRNGKEVIIDAKKAAAILGQGGAIHEEARELKIQRSEFEEYEREQRARHEGLTLAMEFTIEPRLRQAYDEILRTQGYQTTFQQQLQQTRDPAAQARIRASMEQNERYIQQQGQLIAGLKPQIDQFRQIRQEQVNSVLESNRKSFKDKELKNEYVYRELREKISKDWADAQGELVPGIKNIDLVASDEHILGLIRDGLKFRDKPSSKSAGASIAQLQTRKGSPNTRSNDENISNLREAAKTGDKKAGDNLLMARLREIRTARTR